MFHRVHTWQELSLGSRAGVDAAIVETVVVMKVTVSLTEVTAEALTE